MKLTEEDGVDGLWLDPDLSVESDPGRGRQLELQRGVRTLEPGLLEALVEVIADVDALSEVSVVLLLAAKQNRW